MISEEQKRCPHPLVRIERPAAQERKEEYATTDVLLVCVRCGLQRWMRAETYLRIYAWKGAD